ncbi:hypothetical protein ACHAXT_002857 [Thalassiosira profunda]
MPAFIRKLRQGNNPGMYNRFMSKMSSGTRSGSDPISQTASSNISEDAEGSSSVPESRNPTGSMDEQEVDASAKSDSNVDCEAPLRIEDPDKYPRALKVLFLSSDTGGGHRASATSLAQQFQNLFPGSVYALCDIVMLDGPPPYNMLVKTYKHLSCHPQQWKLVYSVSNTRAYEMLADVHMKSAMERSVRRRIKSYDPDVVVSVHPLMTNVPVLACKNIAKETQRHLPIFTVCTDLGSAHSFWFANGVEKLFVASEAIRDLAMQRGKVREEKIVMSGLPIRHDFAVQAEKMGERHSEEGKVYQKFVREQLGLEEYSHRKTVLVMGGGEGCGRLSNIVDALYLQFVERGIEALILVVCGRNDKLKDSLAKRDWEGMREKYLIARTTGADFESCVGLLSDIGCLPGSGGMAGHLRRIISSPSIGAGGAPFSPTAGELGYKDDTFHTTSLPTSRTGTPEPSDEEEQADSNIEVMTKSCAQRNNLYDLSSLLHPLESKDEDEEGPNEQGVITISGEEVDAAQDGAAAQDEMHLTHENSLVEAETGVKVLGLGFITNMAEYMVATDVLVSKAGPGTIAEAASLSLPVMLTSFLPGQEEGNVDYVVDGEFGTFVSDNDPQGISDVVAGWLLDEDKLRELSDNAHKRGAPDAAAEIVDAIGESALRWKRVDEAHEEFFEGEGVAPS